MKRRTRGQMTTHASRTLSRFAALALLAAVAFATHGCGSTEMYGEPLSGRDMTSISDILASPATFEGQTVKVQGVIALECSTGCWFNLDEDGAVIHIDIKPAGLAIPQYVGKTVTTEGVVHTVDRQTMIVGKAVEVH